MNTYHKIQTVFLRNPETKFKTLLEGQYSKPEFEYLANNEWVYTEKVDGTSIRVIFNGERITFGGKTDRSQIPAQLVTRLEEVFLPKLDAFSEIFSGEVCIYGEGYGAKIQKGGGNYNPFQDFVIFDIKVGDWWLERENILDIAAKLDLQLDLVVVPIIGRGTLPEMVGMVREGFNSIWGDFRAEGIVARPAVELKARNGSRIITKLKCKDFPV